MEEANRGFIIRYKYKGIAQNIICMVDDIYYYLLEYISYDVAVTWSTPKANKLVLQVLMQVMS